MSCPTGWVGQGEDAERQTFKVFRPNDSSAAAFLPGRRDAAPVCCKSCSAVEGEGMTHWVQYHTPERMGYGIDEHELGVT